MAATCCARRVARTPRADPHRHRVRAAAGLRGGGTSSSRRGSRPASCRSRAGSAFDAQDQAYRDAVLPPTVRKRVSVEIGVSLGWERWVGDEGAIIGLDHFGASAPAGHDLREVRVHRRDARRGRRAAGGRATRLQGPPSPRRSTWAGHSARATLAARLAHPMLVSGRMAPRASTRRPAGRLTPGGIPRAVGAVADPRRCTPGLGRSVSCAGAPRAGRRRVAADAGTRWIAADLHAATYRRGGHGSRRVPPTRPGSARSPRS